MCCEFESGELSRGFSKIIERVLLDLDRQLPFADNPDLPDPYVKLYLLPDRAANSKRKTDVITVNFNFIQRYCSDIRSCNYFMLTAKWMILLGSLKCESS